MLRLHWVYYTGLDARNTGYLVGAVLLRLVRSARTVAVRGMKGTRLGAEEQDAPGDDAADEQCSRVAGVADVVEDPAGYDGDDAL
jgi:hypothetical protein